MFSTLSKPNFNFLFTFILSSANTFNLGQSKILSFGKELRQKRVNVGNQGSKYNPQQGSKYDTEIISKEVYDHIE